MEIHKDHFLSRAMTMAGTPMFMIDRSSRIVWTNQSYAKTAGKSPEALQGTTPSSFSLLAENKDFQRRLWQSLFQGDTWVGEMRDFAQDGEQRYIQSVITPLPDARGNAAFFLVMQHDITAQREKMQQMWHVAHHDMLTGLANRTLFSNLLEHTVHQSKRNGEACAILFIDLDKFKPVNDTYGHHVGDALLKHAGQVLRENTREADVVARFGGDEFGVILTQIDTLESAEHIAGKIVDRLCTPVTLEGCDICFGGSIGIATFPDDAQCTDDLLKAADAAMYAAKEAGRNCYRAYSRIPLK